MKNNKIFKVILGVVITSFIFVLCFGLSNVYAAEEVVETTTAVATTTTTEKTGVITSALDWLKQIDVATIKGWLGGFVAYLGANFLVILVLAIKVILNKTKEYKQDKYYQELVAKLDAEHQKKVEDLIDSFNSKLEDVLSSVNSTIESLDEKKKEEAKANIEVLKKNLDDIKIDLEK